MIFGYRDREHLRAAIYFRYRNYSFIYEHTQKSDNSEKIKSINPLKLSAVSLLT